MHIYACVCACACIHTHIHNGFPLILGEQRIILSYPLEVKCGYVTY